mmetsp:Transcript_3694/g.7181  ORF Transcript_3694/g.7181 Transcript_3694/m.7181 type:complete len:80 (+) Transcript_3694:969-1208(+)
MQRQSPRALDCQYAELVVNTQQQVQMERLTFPRPPACAYKKQTLLLHFTKAPSNFELRKTLCVGVPISPHIELGISMCC